MGETLALLKKELKTKSQSKVATELDISKATVSLLLSGKYPKPEKMYKKIKAKYGGVIKIIGASCSKKNLAELAREVQEL